MTKDNILYSIIGVLLGLLGGYVFASTVNQRGYMESAPVANASAGRMGQAPDVPPTDQSMPANEEAAPEADSDADRALIKQAEAEPSNFDLQMRAAAIHYRGRRLDEAIQFLTRANQLRPDDLQTIITLGNANFDANRFEIAEKWYAAALVKNPKDINVRTDLGLTFLFRPQQNVDRAIQEFRRSLEIDPRHEQTLQNMTVALIKKGNVGEAEAMLGKLRAVNPANQSLPKLSADLEAARTSPNQPANKGT